MNIIKYQDRSEGESYLPLGKEKSPYIQFGKSYYSNGEWEGFYMVLCDRVLRYGTVMDLNQFHVYDGIYQNIHLFRWRKFRKFRIDKLTLRRPI